MKILLIGLMAFGFCANSVFAGHCDRNTNYVAPPQPMASVPIPQPTVVQQQVVMVPQTQVVDVERTITEYVPQTRTEVIQQSVTVMVPTVVDVEVCPQPQCEEAGYSPQSQPQRSSIRQSLTDKQWAVLFAQRSIDDMKIEGASKGKLRRAKRRLAWLQKKLEDKKTRGGY